MNKVGLKKTWYSAGTIKESFYTLNGKKHGEYRKFAEDGSILISCTYHRGKITGVLEESEEKAHRKLEYKDGKRHGIQFEYIDGKLSRKYFCEKNKLHGEYCIYHPDEQLAVKCNVENGLLSGKLIRYVDGNRKALYNYRKGKFHGECIKYEAKTHMVGYFCDGRPIKKWKEVDKNGKTIRNFISSQMLATSIFQNIKWDISM